MPLVCCCALYLAWHGMFRHALQPGSDDGTGGGTAADGQQWRHAVDRDQWRRRPINEQQCATNTECAVESAWHWADERGACWRLWDGNGHPPDKSDDAGLRRRFAGYRHLRHPRTLRPVPGEPEGRYSATSCRHVARCGPEPGRNYGRGEPTL